MHLHVHDWKERWIGWVHHFHFFLFPLVPLPFSPYFCYLPPLCLSFSNFLLPIHLLHALWMAGD